MYRAYAARAAMRINLGIRRRLAPLVGNDRRKIELLNGLLFSLPGHAGPLLRRRDRDGRQRLPRRSQRRAHADAVERRPQRRLLARQPAAAHPAGHHRPRVPLRVDQRREPAAEPELAALVDQAPHRAAQALPGLRPRHDRVPEPGQPARARLRARSYERRDASSSSPTCRASCSTSSSICRSTKGLRARRALRPDALPADRRRALPADARARTASTGSRSTTPGDGGEVSLDLAARGRSLRQRRGAPRLGKDFEDTIVRLPRDAVVDGRAASSRVRAVHVEEAIRSGTGADTLWMTILRVEYSDGDGRRASFRSRSCRKTTPSRPDCVLVHVRDHRRSGSPKGALVDAVDEPPCSRAMLAAIAGHAKGARQESARSPSAIRTTPSRTDVPNLDAWKLGRERHDTTLRYGDRFVRTPLSAPRRGRHARARGRPLSGASVASDLTRALRGARAAPPRAEPLTLALVQAFVPHVASGWRSRRTS